MGILGTLLSVFGFLKPLLGLASGGSLSEIGKEIAGAIVAKEQAKNDQERIAAETKIATLNARRDVLVAEAGKSKGNIFMRIWLGMPVGIFLWKVIVFDKVLDLGSTDDLSPNLWYTVFLVLGFYFLAEINKK